MKKRTLALIMALVLMLSVAIPGTLAVSLDASSTETTFSLDTEAPAPIAETPAEEEAGEEVVDEAPVEEAPAEEPADVEPAEEEPADVEPVEEAEPEEEVDVKDVTVNEAATQSGEFVVPADNTVVDVNESVDEDDADEDDVTLPECTCPEGYNRTTDYDHDTNCALNLARLPELSNEQMALLWPTLTETERAYILKYAEVNYFTNAQIEYIEKLEETQKKQDYCETITSVTDEAHGVTVSGVPEGVTLSVNDVEAENAIVALDITLKDASGNDWQPYEDGDFQKYTDGYVALTLNLSEYALEDGTVVTLNHTHNGDTTEYLYVVIDGKITFYTDRFSVYVVSEAKSKEGTKLSGTTISMTVGDEKHLYWRPDTSDFSKEDVKAQNGQNKDYWNNFTVTDVSYTHCLWQVSDDSNTISYTVYDDGYVQSNPIYSWEAQWISVTAQSAGTAKLKLTAYCTFYYSYQTQGGGGNPTPGGDQRRYGQQTVKVEKTFAINVSEKTDFHIEDKIAETGCLVPVWDGNDNTEGYTYTWARSDGQTVKTDALHEDGKVNVSLDRGGVTNDRAPITYTVTASKEGETPQTASFKVIYGQEVLNPSFENPDLSEIDDGYDHLAVYNGYEGLYWKTTAPGSGDVLGADVELWTLGFGNNNGGPNTTPDNLKQYAELNAEAAGTLYQDLLTTSGATLSWLFSHAGRTDGTNKMYIVIAATKDAQKITNNDDIKSLIQAAGDGIPDASTTASGKSFVYDGGTYYIWQHKATEKTWSTLKGTYTVPEGQYLTRLFFAADPNDTGDNTKGNFIDGVDAGEKMSYKIEYYPNGTLANDKIESDNGSVYTTVQLKNLQSYLNQGYVITSVKVNNKDYSGDIRNGLYITDYGTVEDQTENILVKITLRKKAITVTKKVTIDGWDELTDKQKAELVNGYQATFTLTKNGETTAAKTATVEVSNWTTGAVTVTADLTPTGGNIDGTYTVKETTTKDITGYKLASTTYTGGTTVDGGGVSVTISDENPTAAVTVTNHYEQLVKISYVAVGPTGTTNFGSVSPESETVKVKSGTAQGSTPTAGDGFKFVGWYTDADCTTAVTTSWVGTDNKLVPAKTDGKNVAATYYAKFEWDVADLTITKTGADDIDENQAFVFTVTGPDNYKTTVVIKGNSSVTIKGLKIGEYTVHEESGWSWRYSCADQTKTLQPGVTNEVTMTNTREKTKWLDGNAYAKNDFNN